MKLTEKQYEEIYEDFQKCDKICQRLASLFPEETKTWTGTVSERIKFLTDKLIEQNSSSLIVSFVQGVQWWEFKKTDASLWNSDRNDAEKEAAKREENGTLGKLPKDWGA